jgi:hypothetical protein
MPGVADTSGVSQLALCWAAAAGGAVFLAVSTWHNGRSGFQKPRKPAVIEDAVDWILDVGAFLSDVRDAHAPAKGWAPGGDGILQLATALERNKGATPTTVKEPVPGKVTA